MPTGVSTATPQAPSYPSGSTVDSGLQMGGGLVWAPDQFTYSIPSTNPTFGFPGYYIGYDSTGEYSEPTSASGYKTLNTVQGNQFYAALQAWDSLIAPDFVGRYGNGNVSVAFTHANMDASTWGYAYAPAGPPTGSVFQYKTDNRAGDIWINADNSSSRFPTGGFDYEALLHEIGHAIGLKHPFEAPALPSAFDNSRYTVMTYDEHVDLYRVYFAGTSGSLTANFDGIFSITPMVLDVAAIQDLYGADPDTATGDTTWAFNSDIVYLQTLYDAGGVDTFDVSALTRASLVDLRPGAYSDVGAFSKTDQIAFWTAKFPTSAAFIASQINSFDTYTWTQNVGIALNTVIENAIGSAYADTLIGNSVANTLKGGAGNDTLDGLEGRDTALYSVARATADLTHNADGSWTIAAGADGTDTLRHMEVAHFSDQDVALAQPGGQTFNLDDKSDVLWRNDSGEIYVWNSQSGQGAFLGQTLGNPGSDWRVQDVADYSGDGKADILWRNNAGDLYAYTSGAGTATSFNGQSISYVDPVWAVVPQGGDFNLDGRADILFRNSVTGEVYVWASQTGSDAVNFLGQSLGSVGTDWSIKAVGDFNGDTRSDILWRSDAGDVYVWLGSMVTTPPSSPNSAATTSLVMTGQTIASVGNDWSLIGIGDFNGDGREDILWRHTDGELYVWNSQLGSAAVNFVGQSLGLVGLDWSVASVGDYDGDGRADVLFRNADGRVYLWNSDDTGAVGFVGQGLGTTATDWHILSDFHGM
jgi:hypothetical protein